MPAFSMHTVQTGTDDLPRNLEVMQVYDRMQAAFPGGEIPAVVAVEADDVTTPAMASAIKDLERKAVATGELNGPVDVRVSPDKHVALVNIPMDGNGTDATSTRALAELRGGIVQATVGSAPGVKNAYVSGMAAQSKDLNDLMASARADRVRVRPHARVHPAARDVPVDRDPDQGDHPQPAVGGRRVRRPRPGLPGGSG